MVAAGFGLDIDAPRRRHEARRAMLHAVGERVLRSLAGGGIALVTGPSGAGKSTLLAMLRARLDAEVRRVRMIEPEVQLRHIRGAICTLSPQPLDVWLAHLARFGLAEAMVWLQRPGELSAGQRWRLALALRFVGVSPTLMADEFAALLDGETARALSMNVRREASRSAGARLLLATSRDDLTAALRPEVHVALTLEGEAQVRIAGGLPRTIARVGGEVWGGGECAA
jgi:hypothetical protein